MSDLIRRDLALSALGLSHNDHIYIDKRELAKKIEAIPAAEPKRAEWIVRKDNQVMCSCCGYKRDRSSMENHPWNFCSDCGADMRRQGQ